MLVLGTKRKGTGENYEQEEIKGAGESVSRLRECCRTLQEQMASVLIGQSEVVRLLLTGLMSGRHMLVIGVPGLAKTYKT